MGSRVGYEYHYRFSMVDEAEIISNYKLNLTGKALLFEFRANFILRKRLPGEGVGDEIMDSERYDARLYEGGDKFGLYLMGGYRLKEYWMTDEEILFVLDEAIDFAKQMEADPQHSSLHLIPVAVDLDVCTVQQYGEPYDACMDRVIAARNLVPLYLWPHATMERKPLTTMLLSFLCKLRRIRVEDIDEGLALMRACPLCSRNTSIGSQISVLPCNHSFHSHCIVQWLEEKNLCPCCRSPAYKSQIAIGSKLFGC